MAVIQAVIFDMDGLLIHSEPLWQDAEISCFQELGVPITREMCRQQAGRRLDEILIDWHQRFGWTGPSLAEMHQRILAEVNRRILAEGQALPGAAQIVRQMHALGLKTAIASSSPPQLIATVVAKLGLDDCLDLTHSGVHELRGKPDPAIFLTTARLLQVEPAQCLVFEDAPAGVAAAASAGMRVVAVPSVFDLDDPGFSVADQVLQNLGDFRMELLTA
ncbi:MAG: HAD-IA family hydrolase [Wenzhouxiangella sp.]|nr:HAD-IA family hydrolase [Wenzhouxiangella sp.]